MTVPSSAFRPAPPNPQPTQTMPTTAARYKINLFTPASAWGKPSGEFDFRWEALEAATALLSALPAGVVQIEKGPKIWGHVTRIEGKARTFTRRWR